MSASKVNCQISVMIKRLRIGYMLSSLAVFAVILALSLSSTVPTKALVETPPKISASGNTSLVSTPPFQGWLSLDRFDDYAQTSEDVELALGGPSNVDFTVEGWFELPSAPSSGPSGLLSSANYYLNAYARDNLHDPILPAHIAFQTVYSCADAVSTVAPLTICYFTTMSSSSYPSVGWHHIAGVFDITNNTGSLYLDGNRVGSASVSEIINVLTTSIRVGSDYGPAKSVDEVRISDIARYSGSSYSVPATPFTCDANTRALWHFDEVTGSTVFHDACGADNVLTGYNGAHTEGVSVALPTISGNAGVDSATMNYTGGSPVIADSSGYYSFTVPSGWSGTVTPSKTDYTFTPVSMSYTNVLKNWANQNYKATNTATFGSSWYGSVSIISNKNVVAVGRPHIGSDEVASYSGFSAGALTAYVPMLFKNAYDGGTYDSALYVQNVDPLVDANVAIKYYNSETGALTCTATDTIKPLASKGYWLPTLSATECLPSGLPVGWVGSAVVTSSTTAKIVAIGRPHIGGEVMTYDSFSSGSLTSYLPMLFNGAWGSYDSAYYIQNVDPLINAEVTIKYYNSETGALTCTDTATIAPNTSKGYWLPTAKCLYGASTTPAGLTAGWVGGVVVTSSAAPIVTVGRPHVGTQITTYNGFAAGGLFSYVPMLFRKAYGGTYDSALYVQNVGVVDAAITIKYYKTDGTLTCTATDTIKSLSSKGYWLPTISATQCTSGTGGGLPDDWVGGAVVTSSTANIVAIGRPHIGAQVTTYNGFTSGNSNSYLPMLFKNMWGYNSAFYIQNTDAVGPAAVTVKFYDVDGNLSCVRSDSIPALSTLGYWAPSVTCE